MRSLSQLVFCLQHASIPQGFSPEECKLIYEEIRRIRSIESQAKRLLQEKEQVLLTEARLQEALAQQSKG